MKADNLLTAKIFENKQTSILLPQIKPSKAKIAHFGIGVFHRAHQSLYTLKAMQETKKDDWGVLGIGIMSFDKTIAMKFKDQDCLYTLTQKSSDKTTKTRVINSIVDYIFGPQDLYSVTQRVSNQQIQVITMTITEGGYYIKKDTGEFDITNEKIVAQIQGWRQKIPSTIYGYLVRILDHRMKTHGKGVTILSCDNIQHNGDYLAKGFLSFLVKAHPDLLTWVKEKCTFPNSMVDRITPQSSQKDQNFILNKYGIIDRIPVVSQDFTQWIIQDKFVFQRPPWDIAGAQYVQDVTPYQKMKLRILNGSHQALCYIGTLAGYRYVHEAAKDEIINSFVNKYVQQQVLESLDPVPGVDLKKYCSQVMVRFSNESILDTLSRICQFTSDRIPLFNVPSMIYMSKKKKKIPKSAMIVATWIVYIEQCEKDPNNCWNIIDNRKQEVINAVYKIKKGQKARSFLQLPGMFGKLQNDLTFCQLLDSSYEQMKSGKYLYYLKKMI